MQAQPADSFLMVKPGDEAANPTQADDFLVDLGAYLNAHVPRFERQTVRGYIANREQPALDLLEAHDPLLVFAPPGFYLAHLAGADLTAMPVAEVPRFGKSTERYYLVAPKGKAASLDDLKNRTIRTHFSPDVVYLQRVVFPDNFKPNVHFKLVAADNLADEVFMMIEDMDGAADALLLDEELKTFFEEDDLVWPDLAIVWSSEQLPRDLVVTLGAWSDEQRQGLREALSGMSNDPAGRDLLSLMSSSGFSPLDAGLLERVKQQYTKR